LGTALGAKPKEEKEEDKKDKKGKDDKEKTLVKKKDK